MSRRMGIVMIVLALAVALAMRGGVPQAVWAQPAGAAPAGTVAHTWVLADDAGKPVADGAYDFTFAVYDQEQAGTLLWAETQSGLAARGGEVKAVLGALNALPPSLLDDKGGPYWLEVSVRGPREQSLTALAPRQALPLAPGLTALACPHNHFSDNWDGSTTNYGLRVDQNGTGDGLRAYSQATSSSYGAIYAVNNATTGNGRGVYARSDRGVGLYASSGNDDGLEATTTVNGKSAIYAHSANSNGVWAVSTSRIGVRGASTSSTGVEGVSTTGMGITGTSTSGYGVAGYSSTSNGVRGGSNSAHAGSFTSSNYAGANIRAERPSSWVGVLVNGIVRIQNGNCDGCSIAYSGLNGGGDAIEIGDLVAVAGVKVDAESGTPVIQVRRATSPADVVIGVAVGSAAPPTDPNRSGAEDVRPQGVAASNGQYLSIVVSGLAQVKVGETKVAVGSRLGPSARGAVPGAEVGVSIARAMSEPDENGFVWALISGQ